MTHTKTPTTLADFQYQLNTVSNITQITDGAGNHSYGYDVLDRLTSATHPTQANESYTFDDVGNRTASHQGSSYSYQPFNRLISANGATFGYDTNGNLISKTDASGTWSYTWDYENRLIQASLSGGVTVTYAYDALGRRIQRTSSTSGTTKFVYDGADVIRDLDGSGATIADYLNGPGIDNKLRQTTASSTSYFLTDQLGSTRALIDSGGNITLSLNYDSFGNVLSGSASTRYTYTGREFDEDTGLMYYRARWYDPQQGRFISEDPIGFGGGVNFYAYVGNNSLNYLDPLGLIPQKDCVVKAAAIGATIGAAVGGITGVAGIAGGPLVIITSPAGALKGAVVGGLVGGLAGALICQPISEPRIECPPRNLPLPRSVPLTPPLQLSSRWTCTATCNIQNFSDVPDAPERVTGTGSGSSEEEACRNAKAAAVAQAPRGTYARHCKCKCSQK